MKNRSTRHTKYAGHWAPTVRLALCVGLILLVTPVHATIFKNVAPDMGIVIDPNSTGHSVGGGVSFFDANNDGLLDIITTTITVPPILFRQESGSFVKDEFALIPDSPPGVGNGHLIVDIDNDNDADILLLTSDKNVLFMNDNGTFVDVSKTHCPYKNVWGSSAAAGDFDGDGDQDIYIANYIMDIAFPRHRCAPNELWINDGNGHFTDRAAEWGVDGSGCSLATAMTDYDNDGDLDIMVANDFGQYTEANVLYRNDGPGPNGSWLFTDVSKAVGWDRQLYGMGIATSDVNHDGWLDYYVTSIGNPALLLGGQSGFTDATNTYGANIELTHEGFQVCWAAAFDDLNGDGWLDLLASGGHIPATGFIGNAKVQPHVLLAGGPTLPWQEAPAGWSLPAIENNNARGFSLGDYNQDGHVDIAMVDAAGMLSLYKNESTGAVPLRIRLRATETSKEAYGARVTATCGGLTRVRELTGGGGFAGTHDRTLRLSFPGDCLAEGKDVDLLIRWPSGYTQTEKTKTGASIDIKEPSWIVVENSQITISPTDDEGLPLTDNDSVTIGTTNGLAFNTAHIGNGTWQSSVQSMLPFQLSLTINGKQWPIHKHISPTDDADVRIRFWPKKPVVGQAMRVYALPIDDPTDNLKPLVLSVTASGSTTLTEMQDKLFGVKGYEGLIESIQSTDPLTIHVQHQDTVVAGPFVVTPTPRISLEESTLKYENRYVLTENVDSTLMIITMTARDANGDASTVVAADFSLTVDGNLLEPVTKNASMSQLLIGYAAADIPNGAMLQLWIDGSPFGAARPMVYLDAESEQVNYMTATFSQCSASMETMVADGQDLLYLVMFLRDAYGDTLLSPTEMPLFNDDAITVFPELLDSSHEVLSVASIAGKTPGIVTTVPTLYGTPLPIECTMELVPPSTTLPTLDPDKSTLILFPNPIAASGESTADIDIFPRGANNRLYGSGLVWNTEITLGSILEMPRYNGRGGYVGSLQSGTVPGTATVSVETSDLSFALKETIEFFDTNPPPPVDTDPSADAGGDTEDVSSDADATIQTDTRAPSDTVGTVDTVMEDTTPETDITAVDAGSSNADTVPPRQADTIAPDSAEITVPKTSSSTGGCRHQGRQGHLPMEIWTPFFLLLLHLGKRFCNHETRRKTARGTT